MQSASDSPGSHGVIAGTTLSCGCTAYSSQPGILYTAVHTVSQAACFTARQVLAATKDYRQAGCECEVGLECAGISQQAIYNLLCCPSCRSSTHTHTHARPTENSCILAANSPSEAANNNCVYKGDTDDAVLQARKPVGN